MTRFLTLLLAASCLTAVGQVTYPYNPDGNADGDIAVGDLQDFLTVYNGQFVPDAILIDSVELSHVIDSLFDRINSLEASLNESAELFGCGIPRACNYSPTVPIQLFGLCECPEVGFDCNGAFVGYQVGDFAFGGIVYTTWDAGHHGRVVSLQDVGVGNWGCTDIEVSNGTAEGYGYGNTMEILLNCPSPNIATIATAQGEGWYLPSLGDLDNALNKLGGSVENSFWNTVIEERLWGSESQRMLESFKQSIGWENYLHEMWYWSSSDGYSWGGSARKIDGTGSVEFTHTLEKTEFHLVRAVKDF